MDRIYKSSDALPTDAVFIVPAKIHEPRLSDDVFILYAAPKAAVVRVVAVIAHHKVLILGHFKIKRVEIILFAWLERIDKNGLHRELAGV